MKLRETRAREKLAENKLQVANREIARLTVARKSTHVGADMAVSEIAKRKTKKRNERPESNAKKMTRLIFWASNVATLAAPFMDTV